MLAAFSPLLIYFEAVGYNVKYFDIYKISARWLALKHLCEPVCVYACASVCASVYL